MRDCAVHSVRRGLLFAATAKATASAVAVTPPPISPAAADSGATKFSATPDSVVSPAIGASRIPFGERCHGVRHGGIVRAANSAVTCRTTGGLTPVTPAAANACGAARDRLIAESGGACIGVVSYDGDSGTGGDSLTAGDGRGNGRSIGDNANQADDVMNSSIADDGVNQIERQPAYKSILGYDSDIFDLREALVPGGDTVNVRFRTAGDSI